LRNMKSIITENDFFKLVSWLRYGTYNPNHFSQPILSLKIIAQTL
jgi:hypothetical protein